MSQALEADDIADTVVYQLGLPPHAQVQDVIMRPVTQKYKHNYFIKDEPVVKVLYNDRLEQSKRDNFICTESLSGHQIKTIAIAT